MLATRITDHVQAALGRLMQQYRGRVRMEGTVTALVQQVQDLEDAIFSLNAGRQFYNGTAVGQQLDNVGELVGIKRNGLTDAEYLLFIFGKIASDYSDSTVSAVLNVVGYLFQAEIVLIQEVYPAGLCVEAIGTPLDPSLYSTAVALVRGAVGAGIGLVFVGGSASTHVFRFDGPTIDGAINGFGDLNDPSVGGVFISLF